MLQDYEPRYLQNDLSAEVLCSLIDMVPQPHKIQINVEPLEQSDATFEDENSKPMETLHQYTDVGDP